MPGGDRQGNQSGLVSRLRRGVAGTCQPAGCQPAQPLNSRGRSSRDRSSPSSCAGRNHYSAIGPSSKNQGFVSSPTASASLACRSSNVQNFCAFNSNAQATCSESSVRMPRVGQWRRARSAQVSHPRVGNSKSDHTACRQSLSKLRIARCASNNECLPRKTSLKTALASSTSLNGVIATCGCLDNLRATSGECTS